MPPFVEPRSGVLGRIEATTQGLEIRYVVTKSKRRRRRMLVWTAPKSSMGQIRSKTPYNILQGRGGPH
jgi:hypothetical protein